MPTLVNDSAAPTFPVTIQVLLDVSGELALVSEGTPIPKDETLLVKHKRLQASDPVAVPITIVAPDGGWRIAAEHELDSRALLAWEASGEQCRHTWAETAHEYAVSVTAHPPSASDEPKKRTVFLKVRPEPDLPDP